MDFSYTVIRSSRKTLSLSVTKDAQVIVRAPRRVPKGAIEQFVSQNQPWVQKHLLQTQAQLAQRQALNFSDGQTVPVLGKACLLQSADISLPHMGDGYLLIPADETDREKAVTNFYRRLAANTLPERVAYFATRMGVFPTGVKITAAQTRWGSCSGKNSLCFSWRLLCLSPELIDSVVVHELAHIRHKNHSPLFYREVESVLPDYPLRRQRLKEAARDLLL